MSVAGQIEIESLTLRHGDGPPAVFGVNLTVDPGERLALLGASGSGKTSLLRVVAGLERPTEGSVRLHGRPAAGVPPDKRGVSMCFQAPALYPHLTVAQNLAFGLGASGKSTTEASLPVAELARRLRIEELVDRRPSALSGGQRARAALGKALAKDAPILLLDEPFSGLDASLRVELRDLTSALLDQSPRTAILVTHDPTDAQAFGDRIAILSKGRLAQVGRPDRLSSDPDSLAVVEALSGGRLNRFEGVLAPDGAVVRLAGCSVSIPLLGRLVAETDAGRRLVVIIQPEDLDPFAGEGEWRGRVLRLDRLGAGQLVLVESDAGSVRISWSAGPLRGGELVTFAPRPGRPLLFDAETGERVRVD